jgi:hypothetical protein
LASKAQTTKLTCPFLNLAQLFQPYEFRVCKLLQLCELLVLFESRWEVVHLT